MKKGMILLAIVILLSCTFQAKAEERTIISNQVQSYFLFGDWGWGDSVEVEHVFKNNLGLHGSMGYMLLPDLEDVFVLNLGLRKHTGHGDHLYYGGSISVLDQIIPTINGSIGYEWQRGSLNLRAEVGFQFIILVVPNAKVSVGYAF